MIRQTIGTALLAGSLGIILAASAPDAHGQKPNPVAIDVGNIAAAIKAGNVPMAQQLIAALGKKADLKEVMDMFKHRNKNGLGVGKVPGAIVPDSIDIKLLALGRAPLPAGQLAREADALEEMAYAIAAVVEFSRTQKIPKEAKWQQDWLDWSKQVGAEALILAAAAKGKQAKDVNASASKITATCNACHTKYK